MYSTCLCNELEERCLLLREFEKKLIANNEAVSEVLGLVLLTAIAVIALSGITIVLFSDENSEDTPHSDIMEWVNTSSDILYLKHGGGELINTKNLEIIVNINEDRYVCPPEEVSIALGKEVWEPGDIIKIDLKEKWGAYPENGDSVEVFLVHKESKEIM